MKIEPEEKDDLMELANVVGVGVGRKERGGKLTEEESITVLVRKKESDDALSSRDVVPATISGKQTDVVEVGDITAELNQQKAHRPVHMGVSIGPKGERNAGTAGCIAFAHEQKENEYYTVEYPVPVVVTNNHVAAGENKLELNHPIVQPGEFDGGSEAIFYLYDYVPLEDENNVVDAAIIRPSQQAISAYPSIRSMINSFIPEAGVPHANTVAVEAGDQIKKGDTRTTTHGQGQVKFVDVRVRVNYSSGVKEFDHQIITTSVSDSGDSGSLGMDLEGQPFGLLFAGSDSVTIWNPIEDVLNSLDLTLKPETTIVTE